MQSLSILLYEHAMSRPAGITLAGVSGTISARLVVRHELDASDRVFTRCRIEIELSTDRLEPAA